MKTLKDVYGRLSGSAGPLPKNRLSEDESDVSFAPLEKRVVWNVDQGGVDEPPPIAPMEIAQSADGPPPDLATYRADQEIIGDAANDNVDWTGGDTSMAGVTTQHSGSDDPQNVMTAIDGVDRGQTTQTTTIIYDDATGQVSRAGVQEYEQGQAEPVGQITETHSYEDYKAALDIGQITGAEDGDAELRTVEVINSDGGKSVTTYTADDQLEATTTYGADGRVAETWVYDADHQDLDAPAEKTTYSYEDGVKSSVTYDYDSGTVIETATFDEFDRVSRTEAYDADGNLSGSVDYSYDGDSVSMVSHGPGDNLTEVEWTDEKGVTTKIEWGTDGDRPVVYTNDADNDGDPDLDEAGNPTLTQVDNTSPEYLEALREGLEHALGDPMKGPDGEQYPQVDADGNQYWKITDAAGNVVTVYRSDSGDYTLDTLVDGKHQVYIIGVNGMSMNEYPDKDGKPDYDNPVSGWNWVPADPDADPPVEGALSTYEFNRGEITTITTITGAQPPPSTPSWGQTPQEIPSPVPTGQPSGPSGPSTDRPDIGRTGGEAPYDGSDNDPAEEQRREKDHTDNNRAGRGGDPAEAEASSGRRSDSAGGADFVKLGALGMGPLGQGGDGSGGDGSGGDGAADHDAGDGLKPAVEFVQLENAEMTQSSPEIFGNVALADAEDVAIEKAGAFTESDMLAASTDPAAPGQARIMVAQAEGPERMYTAESGGGAGADGEEQEDAGADEAASGSLLSMKKIGALALGVGAVVGLEAAQRASGAAASATTQAPAAPPKTKQVKNE